MTRVSNLSQSQALIAELMRANQRATATEIQVSSGKKAQYFKGLADQAGILFSAKRVLDRNAHYTQTVTELEQRLDTQALNMSELERAAGELRQFVTDAVANNSGLSLMDRLGGVFQNAVSMLNTQINGQYIYGGTRTNVPPVNITTLTELGAAPTIAGIFENNDVISSAVVDDGVKIDFGFTASDLATDLMTVLQSIKQFNDTNPDGPLGEHLTDAQATFLSSQLGTLKQVASDMTAKSSQNGVIQQQLDTVRNQLDNAKLSAESFVSEIEDVDLSSALTNLQQDQLALQAATRMVAEIGRMSLLDFLPIL